MEDTIEQAWRMGNDYRKHDANRVNCHFRWFATPELKEAWEKGMSGKPLVENGN